VEDIFLMELALMIEGQQDMTWLRWQRIGRAADDLGFAGLYRSDHFTNPDEDLDTLELWSSLTWLASHTSRIEFGPMVSPVSFRHPVITAKTAAAIDDLSGGRFQLGLGAGWQQREHAHYGFDLLTVPQRLQRFQEALEVVTLLLRGEQPANFAGTYYHLEDATMLPHPQRPGGPPIVIGGGRAVLPMVARYGNEWNTVSTTPQKFQALNERLNSLLQQQGRPLTEVKRSCMTRVIFGRTDQEVQQKLCEGGQSREEAQAAGLLVGTAGAIRDQLDQLAAAGAQRVMLQWFEFDDIDALTAMARALLS
jgi:F420-dependent oxidoreductase-like protein